MVIIVFFVVRDDPLRIGFGFGVYSGLMSFIVAVERNGFFGSLLFFVFVGTLLVMFCMVVRMAPNPMFRLFSVPMVVSSGVVWFLVIESRVFQFDVWLNELGGGFLGGSEVVLGELGSNC